MFAIQKFRREVTIINLDKAKIVNNIISLILAFISREKLGEDFTRLGVKNQPVIENVN